MRNMEDDNFINEEMPEEKKYYQCQKCRGIVENKKIYTEIGFVKNSNYDCVCVDCFGELA